MDRNVKILLGVAGAAVAFKIWNDSKALSAALKDKAMTNPTGNNFVAGHTLPTPGAEGPPISGTGIKTVMAGEASLGDANPSTDYLGRGYLDIAEGK